MLDEVLPIEDLRITEEAALLSRTAEGPVRAKSDENTIGFTCQEWKIELVNTADRIENNNIIFNSISLPSIRSASFIVHNIIMYYNRPEA